MPPWTSRVRLRVRASRLEDIEQTLEDELRHVGERQREQERLLGQGDVIWPVQRSDREDKDPSKGAEGLPRQRWGQGQG